MLDSSFVVQDYPVHHKIFKNLGLYSVNASNSPSSDFHGGSIDPSNAIRLLEEDILTKCTEYIE